MIDFNNIEYVVGFWWVAGPGQDWLAFLYRDTGAAKLTLTYRFRYYGEKHGATGDPFKDDDRKSWYQVTSDKPESEMVAIASVMAKMGAELQGTEVDYTEVRGTAQQAMEKLRTKEWCHMRFGDEPASNAPGGSA